MTMIRNGGLRLLSLVLCLACIAGLIQPVAALPQADAPQFIYTSLVHYGAYAGSAVIGQLEDGTAVTVLGEKGDFYKIDCYDANGYIAKSQVLRKMDGRYYVDCNPVSAETQTMECVSLSDTLLQRSAILQLTQQQLGTPYVYGGMAPGGFDCSGLTTYVYKQNGYSLNRCAGDQMQNGLIVAKEGLQVGDLVFFREGWCSELASHVGIYVGNDQIIHAKSGGVRYSDLNGDWYARYFVGARRIVNVSAVAVEMAPIAAAESAASYTAGTGMRTVG